MALDKICSDSIIYGFNTSHLSDKQIIKKMVFYRYPCYINSKVTVIKWESMMLKIKDQIKYLLLYVCGFKYVCILNWVL